MKYVATLLGLGGDDATGGDAGGDETRSRMRRETLLGAGVDSTRGGGSNRFVDKPLMGPRPGRKNDDEWPDRYKCLF